MMLKTFQYDEVPVLETTSGKLKDIFMMAVMYLKGFPMPMQSGFRCRFLPIGKESGTPALMDLCVR